MSDWQPNELRALLERPLFGFASYGRVRFHHRSVLEFLAAERLKKLFKEKGMPFRALKRLIFAETRGKLIVRPTMRPVAGWLALVDDKIFELLRDNEPAVLFNEGDPEALAHMQRKQALRAYVEQHGKGGWRGFNTPPQIQIYRFAFSELAKTIAQLWQGGIENPETREMLLALVETGRINERADIAYSSAVNVDAPRSERLAALEALMAIDDARIASILDGLLADQGICSNDFLEGAIIRLFPNHISIKQLCQALEIIEEDENDIVGIGWCLSSTVANKEFSLNQLEELRSRLTKLLSTGLDWEGWGPLTCDKSHLGLFLAAVCVRGLKLTINDDWLSSSVLSLRLHDRSYSSDETAHKKLRKKLIELNADMNERLFWVEDSLMQSCKYSNNPRERLFRTVYNDGIVTLNFERDFTWMRKSLEKVALFSFNDRAFLLKAALSLVARQKDSQKIIAELKKCVRDQPSFIAEINEWLKPTKPSKWEKEAARREEKRRRKAAKDKASWVQFWREIAEQPDNVFSSEHYWNTSWDLWRVMQFSQGDDSQAAGWNRHFIEENFGKETADKLRLTLMRIWRKNKPALKSERPEKERNTYLVCWKMGLAAIYAEAEDPDWTKNLSKEEAALAARYTIMELNRLPLWTEQLVEISPDAIDATLGKELSWELDQYDSTHRRSSLLQDIDNAPESVAKLFLPRLNTWLAENEGSKADGVNLSWKAERLQQVLEVLLEHGGEKIRANILSRANRHLSVDLPSEFRFVWLPILMKLDPNLGVTALEREVKTITPSKDSEVVKWFGVLFRDRHDTTSLSYHDFSPQLLLRLLRLAHEHVRQKDDIVRKGTYSPGNRDNAQHARSDILEALLKAKGEAGWQAKLEIAGDPIFMGIKARILALAEESWAQEIDSEILDDEQAIALDRFGEAPATTNSAMFAILKDRLSDLDDLLLSDSSPRDAWANINDEKIMRREIARELKNAAKGLYTVDQEAVTADEKETDIRLRSTVSDHEAIIELKLADGRSARDLRDTIENQLVRKYMAAETSRSGCLLFTIAKNRRWDHPDGGQRIELGALQSLLNDEAKRVQEMMGSPLSLTVHCLNLQPRLPKEK